ncbi:MAG: hypothetical protein KatS3mg088_144 [Patescibacteria group bacterium]|nr:MAG: hypothetical protein KatS3mg088_144 [Patescibacteria group bacterium]
MPEEGKNKVFSDSDSQVIGETVNSGISFTSIETPSQPETNPLVNQPAYSGTENSAMAASVGEEKLSQTQTPSVYINSVQNPLEEEKKDLIQSKSQKTLLFLALFLFIASIFGLAFYFVSAWKENRLGNKSTMVSSPQPIETVKEKSTTPLPSQEPTLGWQEYSDEVIKLKYPQSLTIAKEGAFWVFRDLSDQNNILMKFKILPMPTSRDLTTTLFNEAKKTDSAIILDKVRKSLTLEDVGPYQLVSYQSESIKGLTFSIFEETKQEKVVFVLDYSLKLSEEKYSDVVKEIISTVEFVGQEEAVTTATASPSASPSGKFNVSQ